MPPKAAKSKAEEAPAAEEVPAEEEDEAPVDGEKPVAKRGRGRPPKPKSTGMRGRPKKT